MLGDLIKGCAMLVAMPIIAPVVFAGYLVSEAVETGKYGYSGRPKSSHDDEDEDEDEDDEDEDEDEDDDDDDFEDDPDFEDVDEDEDDDD